MSFDDSEMPLSSISVDQVISSLATDSVFPHLLLHVCCAPCASYVLELLLPHFSITLLFYNPNIQPEEEYHKRAAEVEKLFVELVTAEHKFYDKERVGLIISDYCGVDFEATALKYPDEQEGGMRCRECFRLRLEKTAHHAEKEYFEYFTTTLTVSPHKNAALINDVGCGLADACETDKAFPQYLCADFKKRGGYKRTVELSKQFGLYRQDYCGCLSSKKSRIKPAKR